MLIERYSHSSYRETEKKNKINEDSFSGTSRSEEFK